MEDKATKKSKKEKNHKTKKTSTKQIKKERTKKDKINLAFGIVYALLFLIFFILAIIDGNMPNSQTSELIFVILIFVIIEITLFLMFTQNLLIHKNKKKKLLSYFAYIINAVILALRLVCGGDVLLLVMFVYNTILGIYLAINFTLYKTKFKTVKFFDKKIIFVVSLAMFSPIINALNHSYVNDGIVLLYALIPMAILIIIFAILSFTVFKKTYEIFAKKIWAKIGVVFLAIVLSYCYGMAFVDVANTSFDYNPQQIECVIVDKNVTGTGYRQITQYNLYVIINGQKVAIDVSLDLYKSKKVDDTLIVHYYKGNLNIPYYESGETLKN